MEYFNLHTDKNTVCLQNIGPPGPNRGNKKESGTEEKDSSPNIDKKCWLLV